jgi:hypothetical protein
MVAATIAVKAAVIKDRILFLISDWRVSGHWFADEIANLREDNTINLDR